MTDVPRPQWDLNADLGEGDDTMDESLLAIVTSANVACGGHAGDARSMARICALAARRGVAIGAQVSYVDREGFGRRRLDVTPSTLCAQVAQQVADLVDHARAAATEVTYVKPHGALYHAAATDPEIAEAILDGAAGLPVLTLPVSALRDAALARGIEAHAEGFADRGYLGDGSLVPRGEPGDLVTNADEIDARVRRLVVDEAVIAVDGTTVPLAAQSLCVHADTPGADAIARRVRSALEAAGVEVRPFAPPRRGR